MKTTFLRFTQVVACTLALVGATQAASPRFVPNAAGDEVRDTETGLTWQRCPVGTTWSGSTCAGTATTFTWKNALAQAKTTAGNTQVAWRLPNVKELASLVTRKIGSPLLDTAIFPQSSVSMLWTSTPQYGSAMFGAWVVNPWTGYIEAHPDNGQSWYTHGILLVRDSN